MTYLIVMAHRRYPNFQQAQRERGRYYRSPGSPIKKRIGFAPLVSIAFAATFTAVLFGDRIPGLLDTAIKVSRNLGRDHAPPIGAYYPGCDAARAAGVAPIYRDEPGYRDKMDGDGDGIACEPYRSD